MFRSPKDVQITNKRKRVTRTHTITEYSCDFCEHGPWPTELDVEIHMKSSHNWVIMKSLQDEGSGMCPICIRMQKDTPSLIQHIKQIHLCSAPDAKQINREIYICDLCDRLFFNKQLLIAHIAYWHAEKDVKTPVTITCPKCWKLIRHRSLWFHFLYHGVLNISTCPICLETCADRAEMIEHLKTHPGYFYCNICRYESNKEIHFTNHYKRHKKDLNLEAGDDVSRFFLPRKNITSTGKRRMNNVFKGIPFSNLVSVCILCRALCETEEEMRQHILGDHRPEEEIKSKTYMCSCGEEFFNNVLLKHHIFRMQGDHRVWDGVTATSDSKTEVVYQIFEISDAVSMDVNEIIITQLGSVPISEQNDSLLVSSAPPVCDEGAVVSVLSAPLSVQSAPPFEESVPLLQQSGLPVASVNVISDFEHMDES